jgi:transcription termination/antitermination protein NusG
MTTSLTLGRWYALAVTPGREAKIRAKILDRLERRGVSVPGLTIVCPEEEIIVEGTNGDPERKTRMSLPGYLLAHCRKLDENAVNQMSAVAGVIEFLGGNENPTQLPPSEVTKILGTDGSPTTSRVSQVSLFSEGDSVWIIEGPLSDFPGKIVTLNEGSGIAKVEVEIFGRTTPAEVKLRQLRRD